MTIIIPMNSARHLMPREYAMLLLLAVSAARHWLVVLHTCHQMVLIPHRCGDAATLLLTAG
jgi:hypothetical protein